jgi:pSer/pThr/pTyr-binding forkhead associated (FHA) protein
VKGDFSRFTFAEENHYRRVLMQQGRVEIDADGNEQIAIDSYRAATTATDVIGQAGYPMGTLPNGNPVGGFALGLNEAGADVTISPGRMYVDGLLVENDTPDATLLAQPDMPGATTLTAFGATQPGIYVAYLDVWERLITALDNPAIRESALGGSDTSVRTKLVWQLKLASLGAAPSSGASLPSCASAGEPWLAAAASTGTLAAGSAPPGASMPCSLPPEAGYQRLENQLYRVEIHQPGPDGTATFKWSRENGSVVTLISAPPATGGAAPPTTVTGPTFSVTGLSDDLTLGLQAGDWVELTDDNSELTVGYGQLYQVNTTPTDGQHVTITAITAPTVTLSLNPKLRRWDQSGTGLDQGITVTTTAPILLEGGVQVQFSAGTYQTGDYWLIPARTATSVQQGFVEWPVDASFNPVAQPPLGINHHYAKLGLVELTTAGTLTGLGTDTVPTDCRLPFPPLTGLIDDGCCTVDVGPADFQDGTTLQSLLGTYANKGPITVCLEPGTYTLPAPLALGPELDGITLQGCREGVVLQAPSEPGDAFVAGLIAIQGMSSVTIRGVELSAPLAAFSPPSGSFSSLPQANQSLLESFSTSLQVAFGVSVADSAGLTIEDCTFELPDPGQANCFGVGIFATGTITGLEITGCTFQSANPPKTVPFNDLAVGNQTVSPYQLTFGYLQLPAASAFSTPATSQLLHDAAIQQSLFQGVTVPALAMTQLGTLRVDQNTVRNCYGGFWFLSFTDTSIVNDLQQLAAGNPGLYLDFVSVGTAALIDRIFVMATAMGQALTAPPPAAAPTEPTGPGRIFGGGHGPVRVAAETTVTESTHSAEAEVATHSAEADLATRSAEAESVTRSAAQADEVAGAARFSNLMPDLGDVFTRLGLTGAPSAPPVPVIPAADPGTSVSLRFDLSDCQIDAIITDSYSGAGLFLVDFTSDAGSALLHGNRIRSRFPGGETVLVYGLSEASVTGNIVANELVPFANLINGQQVTSYSITLNASNTLLATQAVAITGNVFIDPTNLPARPAPNLPGNDFTQAIATWLNQTFAAWDVLNTVTNWVVPPAVTSISPTSGLVGGGTAVTVTGSGFTGATQVSFGTAGVNVTPPVPEGGTQVSVTSPAGSQGTVDVTVTTPAGVSPVVQPADQFTYTLFRRIGVVSESEREAEAAAEPAPQAVFKPAVEPASEPEAEAASEPEPEAESAPEVEPKAEAPSEPEPEAEPKAEAASEPEPEAESAPEVEPKAEAPSEPEPEAEPEADAPSVREPDTTSSEPRARAATAATQILPTVAAKPALRLRVTNSPDEGRTFDLQPGESTIGREEGSTIQLQGPGVSHNHALLRVSGDNATIEDLRSTNGTAVNGALIDRQTPLVPGDQIDVGGVQLTVEQRPTASPDES